MTTETDLLEYVDVSRIRRRLDELSEISSTTEGVTRLAYSEGENQAFEYLVDEIPDHYSIKEDSIGNLFATPEPDADRSVFTGSHLDTVFNGGHLDGTLGVVTSLEAVDAIHKSEVDASYPPTLVIFRAEESARFGYHTIGSRGALGMLETDTFAAVDQNGVPLWRAMQDAGFQPTNLSEPSIDLDRVAAFMEIHIEQGRVLEEQENDVGIVSSIRAPVRYNCSVHGKYDHSGATPMGIRRDALTAASSMIVEIETIAERGAEQGDLVGTVGTIESVDGSINQVCGEVVFTIDLRSTDIAHRDEIKDQMISAIEEIADSREVDVETELIEQTDPVNLDNGVVSCLKSAAKRGGADHQVMPSGGGHDAMNFQLNNLPTGMLFVPSIDGVSHNPNERTTSKGIEEATQTLAMGLASYE